MFVFHDIHVMLSILFPGDLLRKLGKFVTTLHSRNSSSDCFHTVLNSPFLLSLHHPLAHFSHGWPFTSGQFWDMNQPPSYFIFSVVFPLCSIITHCIFSTFPSYHIGFVCLPETSQMVSWFSEITGLYISAHGYHALLVFWEMLVNLGRLQVPKLKGAIPLPLIFPNA